MNGLSTGDRPLKRRRLHNGISDPILDAKRARHDLHLKSRFEEIFQKYGRDFSDTADEIDLETGEIVVDKGHLAAMTDETDPGRDLAPRSQQDLDVPTAADNLGSQGIERFESDDEDILANPNISSGLKTVIGSQKWPGQRKSNNLKPLHAETPKTSSEKPRPNGSSIENPGQTYQSSPTDCNLFNVNTTMTSLHTSYRSLTGNRPAVEPAWQAPPLPNLRLWDSSPLMPQREISKEPEAERSPSPTMGSLWASKTGPRRPRSRGPERQGQFQPAKRKFTAQRRQSDPVYAKTRDGPYVSSRKHPKRWTREEEERLVELKTKTQLKYSQMLPYFPGKKCCHLSNHWSSILLYSKRNAHVNSDNTEELLNSIKSNDRTVSQNDSPTIQTKYGISLSLRLKDRISSYPSPTQSSNGRSQCNSLQRHDPNDETQRLSASLDYTDELGDDLLEERPAISDAVTSLPVVACSKPHSPVKPTKASNNCRTTTPKDKTPPSKKQTNLEEVTIDGKAYGSRQNGLSDSYDELGMSPPPKSAGAPASQFRTCSPASTPMHSRKRKGLGLSGRPVKSPRPSTIDTSSEDELATPIKSIKASHKPTSRQLNNIRTRNHGLPIHVPPVRDRLSIL